MAPALARAGQLLRSILRIVDENVRAGSELTQFVIEWPIAGFVVRGVYNGAAGSFDAIAQAALWVIDVASGNFVFTDGEGVAAADFHEFLFGGHGGHVHRKIRDGHLPFKKPFPGGAGGTV